MNTNYCYDLDEVIAPVDCCIASHLLIAGMIKNKLATLVLADDRNDFYILWKLSLRFTSVSLTTFFNVLV